MSACDRERLSAFYDGALAPDEAREVEAHVAGCEACKDDLAAFSAEDALFAARRASAGPINPEILRGVERRTARPLPRAQRPSNAMLIYGGLVAAAVASFVIFAQPRVESGRARSQAAVARRTKVPPEVTLDRADREYQRALAVLEAEYRAERVRLAPDAAARVDRQLEHARGEMVEAQREAGRDVDGRLALLDGYQEYMRSLQVVVADLQVKR